MDIRSVNRSKCFLNKKKYADNIEEHSKNAFLSVTPPEIKFIFVSGNFKVQEKTVEVTNYFSKSCPIQILPLDTRYFRVENALQRRWLSPGSVCKINVSFVPDESRDYNDVLKIRYSNDQIIQIRISAKIERHFSFPATVNFGDIPLGRAACYKIPICSYAENKFSFAVLPSKEDPCVDVYPRWGHVRPGQEPVTVMVIYRPLRYVSMNFQIRIFVSNSCKVPYVINFYAYTRPGLLREILVEEPEAQTKMQPVKATTVSSKKITRISLKKDASKSPAKESVRRTNFQEALLKQCDRFPLYALHAVNCILNSKIRKSHGEHELKGPLNVYVSQLIYLKAQQLKEFLAKAENYRRENEQAKIHHKPKVNYGTRALDEDQIVEIKMQREQAWNDYEDSKASSPVETLFERLRAEKIRQRILRVAQKYPHRLLSSSGKENSLFHYCKVVPFLQTARKVILTNRLLKILEKLKQLTPELVAGFE